MLNKMSAKLDFSQLSDISNTLNSSYISDTITIRIVVGIMAGAAREFSSTS